ncbi:MAG: hypothetical protein JRI68_13030 [Deltaproteobacteria bacterium]|nr:hypothetical protein [Deltaproteobacteria bacterium]
MCLSFVTAALAASAWATGCAGATDTDAFGGSNSSGTGGQGGTTSGVGGGGGQGASTSSGTGGSSSPCAIDCTQIQAPVCQVAQCNAQTGQCEVVAESDGTTCDDGVFCTVNDGCLAGVCTGGPENDCGITAPQCTEVTCDEQSQACNTTAAQNGDPCQDPNDLCMMGATCMNGLCAGGTPEDCFFSPVPDDCHVAECNPQTGQCEPVVGNEGGGCADPNDLCTVGKLCTAGVCGGGQPKDCSNLTQGCVMGVCDVNTGICGTQQVGQGQPCDDLDGCTTGELCNNGQCTGGTPIVQCINNDNCCPSNCNENNDQDCAKEEYFGTFPSGTVSYTAQQCVDYTTFVGQLTGAFTAVQIKGSLDPTGATCNNPAMATQLCNALNTSTLVSGLSCNGRTWNVGDCSNQTNQPFEINSRTASGDCTCETSNSFTVRPCINNNNWGGIGDTCGAPAQTLEVICFR